MSGAPQDLFAVAAAAPWLAEARATVGAALARERLPHALLLLGPPGIGKAALAEYIARLALCDRGAATPCGVCVSCQLHIAGNHPDLKRVGLIEDKKQILVEDVRTLIGELTLKSFRGGRKVAIIDPADALNSSGANALLKTLEEPSGAALLLLTAARLDRLPATIASRCQRLALAAPSAAVALEWLRAIDSTVAWEGPLALAAGAPLGALALADRGAIALSEELAKLPEQLSSPAVDLVGLADHFKGHLPAERLRWIENWVTERIRRGLATTATGHTLPTAGLRSAARTRHIQALYAILDELRTAQAALRGNANAALLFERVLGLLAGELAALRAARPR
jgi:DNA polymerase III subunit delta'